MLISELYNKIQEFTELAITSLTDDKVIFANQSTARPLKPFVTIALSGFKNVGTPIVRELTANGIEKITSSMLCTATFMCFSDTLHEAEDLLDELYSGFSTELQNRVFKGEVALQKVIKHVTALPVMQSEQMESTAILELGIAFNKTIEDNVGIIEKVVMHDSINNKEFIINKEE